MTQIVNKSMIENRGDTTVQKKSQVSLQIKEFGDENGTIKGYGSVYGNIDQAGDIMAPNCFAKSISDKAASGKKFKFLYQHNWDDAIGVIEVVKEDFRGLYIEVKLNLETQKGRETYALVKQGAIDGLSVGFLIVKDEMDQRGIRTIREAKLMEVSAVTFPCNEEATITSVKRLTFSGAKMMKFKNSAKDIDACLKTVADLHTAHASDDLTEKQFVDSLNKITSLLVAAKSATIGDGEEPQKSSDGEDDDALSKSEAAEEDNASKSEEPQDEELMKEFNFDDDEDEAKAKSESDEEEEALKALKHSLDLFVKNL